MRLKTIKLAGFKSFVDPTTILLQSNLNAIVGPNGCGKSNIVDALRWVIGESSAKQLRGELLTDVIFNGTAQRKPVGQASVELLFDNQEGRLGGAYAQYSEISIRREITREGQSQFYLNGARCRRKDITDVFLGTGLGPSSYAIIEQGIVSRLIEGKPEEIRVFLEEAAGISKYRERRRETENRIRHTRDNLSRLSDVRTELEKQLEHLKRQANAAERFKVLKQEQRLLKGQLHALRCQLLENKLAEQQQVLMQQTNELEASISQQHRIDREWEESRVQQSAANETLGEVQGRFYEVGAEIARQQQQIQHLQEQERQINADILQSERLWQEAEGNLADDQSQFDTLVSDIERLKPEVEQAFNTAEQAQERSAQAEEQQAEWQSEWESFQAQAAQAEQSIQVERTRHHHLQQKIQSLEQRLQQLTIQQQNLSDGQLPELIEQLSTQDEDLSLQLENFQSSSATNNQRIQQQKNSLQELRQKHEKIRQNLQQLLSRQASLEALQQAALGKADQGVSHWLKQQGWAEKPRLLEGLQVTSGWETAVETVLQPYLEAICTETGDDMLLAAQQVNQGRLALINTKNRAEHVRSNADLLLQKIQSDLPLTDLLAGIYTAENAQEALTRLASLGSQESIITRDGIWFGPNWMRISKVKDETTGVLQRKQALHDIHIEVEGSQQESRDLEQSLQSAQQDLAQLEEQRDEMQRDFRMVSAKHAEIRAQLSAKQTQLEQIRQRFDGNQQEISAQQEQLTQANSQLETITHARESAEELQQGLQERRATMQQQRELQNQRFRELRQKAQQQKQQADELQVRLTSTESKLHYVQQNITRSEKQLTQLAERLDNLRQRREEMNSPLPELQEQLQQSLALRLEIEKELNNARHQVNHIEHQQRELEKQRSQVEQNSQVLRDKLEKVRIEQTSLATHRDNQLQQITEAEFTLKELLDEMPAEANEGEWQQHLEQVDNRIQRLGAINLAAIEEFRSLSERKEYLDAQDQDLCQALETLEDAIRKIDRESRARLKETFDRANENFKDLFGKMFVGGQAELELSGEEVLDAGVIIRAQPPGKRTTMLHLLSGGEKALTAIALVFALFQLNPAPFCVLDEVDAPLDEANVGRYCRLVETMSSSVQFLYISHNKVSMEMAKQLIGVTMHEPGVSRLVSVDIDQALAMQT